MLFYVQDFVVVSTKYLIKGDTIEKVFYFKSTENILDI